MKKKFVVKNEVNKPVNFAKIGRHINLLALSELQFAFGNSHLIFFYRSLLLNCFAEVSSIPSVFYGQFSLRNIIGVVY